MNCLFCRVATLFGSGARLGMFLNIESHGARNGAGEVEMVGQVVGGKVVSNTHREFAISRFGDRLLTTAAVTVVSAAITLTPAMVSQASAQSFSQALVFGDSTVDSGFYKALGNP